MARRIPTKRDANAGILDDGVYLLRVEDAEEKTSPNSGNDYLQLRFSVLKNGEPQGRSLWDILSFQENARFKFDQIFDALDAPEDEEVTIPWFKGKRVYALLATDQYNGNLKNVVKTYLTKAKAEELLVKQREARLEAGEAVTDDIDFGNEPEPEPMTMATEKPGRVSGKGKSTKSRPADMDGDDSDMPL